MAAPRALERSVLADQVKDRLLEDILSGAYPPDARIVETQVARDLNTSQAPVREALRALEALGVVEITPFKGARVRRPTRREIIEAYEVRAALETLGARLAVPLMTDVDIAELVALGNSMQEAAVASDTHEVARLDASFHDRIMTLAGNETLYHVWRSLQPYLRTYITLVAPGADAHWTANLHVPIIDGLLGREVSAVTRALEEHFDAASINMANRWPGDPPPP
jgi:DNA-binding GntR family transcriptional regulator